MKAFDLQVNGVTDLAAGVHCDFWHCPDDAAIDKAMDYLSAAGLCGILATLITAPIAEIKESLSCIHGYLKKNPKSLIKGVHIEGGYISKEGIHPKQYLSELKPEIVLDLVEEFPGLIKLFTLCPRVDKDARLTTMLLAHDVKVAYGHSLASYEEVEKQFDTYAVNLVTHWPNAMITVFDPEQPLRFDHRNPSEEYLDFLQMEKQEAQIYAQKNNLQLGLGFSALHRSEVFLTVIAGSTEAKDLHVHAKILKILEEKKADKLILVSDQVAFSADELKQEKILALRGGRQPLSAHMENAKSYGWDSRLVKEASCSRPLALLR